MEYHFVKYQGTGNDFIMLDGRGKNFSFSSDQIKKICDRKFGIGADGLIILLDHEELDFEMDYYNADGSKSFCGNGSRCAQAFARDLGMIKSASEFLAIDGKHEGAIEGELFATRMGDVGTDRIEKIGDDWFIHTGSPHYIRFVGEVDQIDVFAEGRKIRNLEEYKEEGTNVNFVQILENGIKVRTYERGVEDETLSCGTGVTAAALAYVLKKHLSANEVFVETKGGNLSIRLNHRAENSFDSIWLVGPAMRVFDGIFNL